MTQVVHCECGFNAEGETDDELVQAVQDHVKEAHPEVAGEWSREQILAMAHPH
jgi:predicted small metal-binding protein